MTEKNPCCITSCWGKNVAVEHPTKTSTDYKLVGTLCACAVRETKGHICRDKNCKTQPVLITLACSLDEPDKKEEMAPMLSALSLLVAEEERKRQNEELRTDSNKRNRVSALPFCNSSQTHLLS